MVLDTDQFINQETKIGAKTAKLVLVHELAAKDLERSRQFLETQFKISVELKHINELSSLAGEDDAAICTLHLRLDNEIDTHKSTSSFAFEHGIKQLNPYSKATEYADNKFSFFNLMRANDIAQAESILYTKASLPKATQVFETIQKCCSCDQVVVKPCHGTEKRDQMIFSKQEFFDNEPLMHKLSEHMNQILSYDDCIIQQYINHHKEHRVLYLNGKIYANNAITTDLIELALEIAEIINYGLPLAEQLKIIGFDILEKTNGELIALEANARPAAMYSVLDKTN